ncbi:MAG TPA: discoidin domain-containing protein, partial [Actinocrinis sp.]|uniref:galactose-binding domain-containing protein n=1 Tax=Actinocrinis sp. TaxID=1920516 RepID=UPI002DDD55BD
LSFGSQTVGSTSAAQSVTVTNSGNAAAALSPLTINGDYAQTNNCPGTLNPGASCTATITFTPTATGTRTGTLTITSNAPGSPATVTLTGTGATTNTNLAQGQPTTASGWTQNYTPANAVDGNTSTYWESTDNAFPQWLQVDLGTAHSISRIVLDLPPSTAWGTRTQTLQIQGSTDGTTYTTLVGSQGYTFNPTTGNTTTITFNASTVRYVKLTFTANTGWPAGQLSELQIFSN